MTVMLTMLIVVTSKLILTSTLSNQQIRTQLRRSHVTRIWLSWPFYYHYNFREYFLMLNTDDYDSK